MAQLGFNAANVTPDSADRYRALPNGDYAMVIEGEALKETKDRRGAYLELKLRPLQGEFKEKVIYDRLNLKNDNPQAEEIGKSRLSAICHAIDVLLLNDTNQLLGKHLMVTIRIEKDKLTGQFTDRNIVVGYSKLQP